MTITTPLKTNRSHYFLVIILITYLILAGAYSLVTPLWEAPDEASHYRYAEYLAQNHTLPPTPPPRTGRFFEHGYPTSLYEGYQPPLYYGLQATQLMLLDHLVPTSMPYTFPEVNPHFPSETNLFIAQMPRQPMQRLHTAPGPQAARFFSIFLGLCNLIATYKLGLRISGQNYALALAAVGMMAFIPQYTFLSGYVTNDNLVNLMVTLCLLTFSQHLLSRTDWLSKRKLIGSGLLTSLALLSKLTALFLFPLGLLCLGWRYTQHRSFNQWLRESTFFGSTALSLPLLALALLPGFVDQIRFAIRQVTIRPDYLNWPHLISTIPLTRRSFWGIFGWMNVPTPDWVANVMGLMALIGLMGALLSLWNKGKNVQITISAKAQHLLLWATCCFVLAGFIRFNLAVFQPQGRLLFPALSAFVLLVCLGWFYLVGNRYRHALGVGLVSLVFLINIVSLVGSLWPAYTMPPM